MDIKELDSKYIANTYGRFDLTFVSGSGSLLYDDKGRKYIDLGTGIAVNVFGVADPEWKKAVSEQLDVLPHTSNLFYTKPQAELAQLLCEKTGLSKVFFSNSGAEANECAIKTARKYSSDKYGDGRNVIITLKNSFHGRTLATLAATGQDSFHKDFGPFPEGFVYADANDFSSVQKLAGENNVCAVMMEIVQGEGGVNALENEFVKSVADFAAENDILLIIDEVQTGNGRCGSLYAYMKYNISPDIVTTAKGLGGGLPIGATLLSAKCENVLTAGSHGSTFGGNPVVAAGALSILKRLDDSLFSEVEKKSEYIRSELTNLPCVRSISGMGLMLGIEVDKDAKQLAVECLKNGVVVLTAKNKLRLLPALNISWDDLKTGITLLKQVLS